jgi:hypothetical protein
VGGTGDGMRRGVQRLPRAASWADRLQAADWIPADRDRRRAGGLGIGLCHRGGISGRDRRGGDDRGAAPGGRTGAGRPAGTAGCGAAGRGARLHRASVAGAMRGEGRPALGVRGGGFGHRQGAPGPVHGIAVRGGRFRLRVERGLPGALAPGGTRRTRADRTSPDVVVLPGRPAAVAAPQASAARYRGTADPAVIRAVIKGCYQGLRASRP